MATYKVIDVSEFQGDINWKKVKAAGIVGVIIRYGDGTYKDPKFSTNMKGAKAAGLHIGAYIFSRAKTKAEAESEAKRLYDAASKYKPDMPLYIDLEANDLKRYADTVAPAFLNKMKSLGGWGGVYANLNWWNNYLVNTAKNYSSNPFWIAQYYSKMEYKNPYVMGMWQYTSSGSVDGIKGRVDMDKCYVAYWEKIDPEKDKVVAGMNAWAKKIAADNRYHYNLWEQGVPQSHLCPICSKLDYNKDKKHFGWNCIGFTAAVWHHGGKLNNTCFCGWITGPGGTGDKLLNVKTDAEALALAKKYTGLNDIQVIRNKDGIPKSQWKAGDICLKFIGSVFQHAFYYPGGSTIIDSVGSDGKTSNDNQIKERSWTNYSAKVIIRWTGNKAKPYPGEMPTMKLVKSNKQVIADTIRWACWIAGDNSFHYGKKPASQHNGCYFCGTQDKLKKGKGIVDYEHTYCCNPFVGAAWAHGGCVPAAIKLCQACNSWDFHEGKGYDKSKLFTNLGHPKKSELKPGDVLCRDTHVALYIGDGKIVEAAGGDDNVKGSEKWNNSIRVKTLSDSNYKNFVRVHRFNSAVNAEMCIRHGEISDRVRLLQKYIEWFGIAITADGIFGDGTLKAVEKMQEKLGVTADGIVGPATLAAMKEYKK